MNNNKPQELDHPFIGFFSIIATVYFIYYLYWRATATLNPAHIFTSWLLWASELFGVLSFVLFSLFTYKIEPTIPWKKPQDGKSVDVFIPTYNEDIDILRATFTGCANITYPHQTYVLDDGDRQNVKALAENFGFHYIARPTHEHAKAGNINSALACSNGEFIVILDADMVPQPELVDRTISYFENEKIAIVQLPQEFYNQDSIQHDKIKNAWHEQALFFRVIQPGKNHTDSAFWCGSPSVARRSALEFVGGVATETITEDIHTTVRLKRAGYKVLFVNEALAFGIAPQTIKAFLIQRLRWAQGTMQLYRGKESPLWVKGLTLPQRLSYLSSFLAYFEAFQKFILITIPIAILGFGVFPMSVDAASFSVHWIPYFLLNIFANQISGRGVFQYFKTEKFNLLKTLTFMQSTFILIWPKPLKFQVTPKTVDNTVAREEFAMMRIYVAIFATLIGSMIYAFFHGLVTNWNILTWESRLIAFVWALYNAGIIFFALTEIFTKKHERKTYRFSIDQGGTLTTTTGGSPCSVHDISYYGARVVVPPAFDLANKEITKLRVEPNDFAAFEVLVENARVEKNNKTNEHIVGLRFKKVESEVENELLRYLFIHLPKANADLKYALLDWSPLSSLKLE